MNANELTALISECLREIDDHEFFLKLESVLRQQQAEIEALKNWQDTWRPFLKQHFGIEK